MMLKLLFLALTLCTLAPTPLHADGEHEDAAPAPKDVTEVGPAAAFDSRLPPVIPGEEISHNGRKMRVWSSSGPVPVSKEPEPWNRDDSASVGQGPQVGAPIGVIVDKRDGRH